MKTYWLHSLSIFALIGSASLVTGCSDPSFSTSSASGSSKATNTEDVLYVDEVDTTAEEEIVEENYNCSKRSDDEKKVLICHVPPGNPEARHEICISRNAVDAHIGVHGDDQERDYYGYCKDAEGHDRDRECRKKDDSDDDEKESSVDEKAAS